MTIDVTDRLHDFDDEDIFDVVGILQDSFGLKFRKDAFFHVQTFGDLLRVFESYLVYPQADDCTNQQAFYKVRSSLQRSLDVPPKEILPQSLLTELFPKKGRKKVSKAFKRTFGVDVRLLTYSDTVSGLLVLSLLLSFIALFFAWKVALCIIGIIILLFRLEQRLATEFAHPTVSELVRQLSTEHYMSVRRNQGTVNRREVGSLMRETFAQRLGIDKEELTDNARFSWAVRTAKLFE